MLLETLLQRLGLRVQNPGDGPLGWAVSCALLDPVTVLASQWAHFGVAWALEPAWESTCSAHTTILHRMWILLRLQILACEAQRATRTS